MPWCSLWRHFNVTEIYLVYCSKVYRSSLNYDANVSITFLIALKWHVSDLFHRNNYRTRTKLKMHQLLHYDVLPKKIFDWQAQCFVTEMLCPNGQVFWRKMTTKCQAVISNLQISHTTWGLITQMPNDLIDSKLKLQEVLGALMQQAITWTSDDQDLSHHMVSLVHNLLKLISELGFISWI